MIKQIISVFFAKGAVAGINLCILLFGTHLLGSHIWGQISLFVLNLSVIHAFAEMFTGTALVYFISKIKIKTLYTAGLLWTICCASCISLVFYFFQSLTLQLFMHILFLSILLSLTNFHSVILLAKEKIKAYNFLLVLQPLLLLSFLVISLKVRSGTSFENYLFALYPSFVISFLVSVYFLFKLPQAQYTELNPPSLVDAFKSGCINQLGNLAHTLSNRFNYYLLGSTVLVGVYASSTSLIESLWIIGGSITPIVLTRVANQQLNANNAQTTLLLSKLSFTLSFVCVLAIYLLPVQFFEFVLGNDFSESKAIMLLLAPGILCISFSTVISHYFSALGKQPVLLLANSCGLLTTLITGWYFIKNYGVSGACYTTSMSYFVQAFILMLVFKKQNLFTWRQLLSPKADVSLLRNP